MADGSPPDSDPRAAAADELARTLSTADGQRTLRDLQRLGLLASPPEPPGAPQAPALAGAPDTPTLAGAPDTPAVAGAPDTPRPISIWTPRDEAGETVWTRPPRLPLGDHYADVPELRAKKTGRRICFFGESAAAGYLYAPHLTPARVLEAQLKQAAPDIEVIDLARTNETLAPLVATVRAARQLSPDLLVIYAGNNWSLLETPEISPYPPGVRGRQSYAAMLRAGGILEPARRARERLAGLAGAALAEIAEIAAGIPVILVVPEVNLADWETREPPPWLPGEGTARWYAAYERARAALAAGSFSDAEAAAWEMVDLDGGSGPVPFRLLAAALRGQGREEAARDAAISEVDSVHYPLLALLAAPQATTLAREVLLATAASRAAAGWSAVDLRRLFAGWTGSPLPGRRLFLDYCHLTAEGMEVAMAAVAAEALRHLGSGFQAATPDWRDLVRRAPDPALPPGADAAAKLGAAIHTAHRMLPVAGPIGPLLAHWIEAALDASPAAADALVDLADARTAPLATVLTAAQQRNLPSPCRLERQHGWVYDFLDAQVLAAAIAVLLRRGDPRAAEIERLLTSRLALPASGLDLAASRFHAEPLARFYPELIGERDAALRAHHRAPWPESSFVLVADRPRDLSIALTARLPEGDEGAERRGTVRVEVNGRWAGNLPLGSRWSTRSLTLAGALLRPGLNRLTLRWPPPPPRGEAALEAALRRLEEGLPADLHPVFGEVWSLVARPA